VRRLLAIARHPLTGSGLRYAIAGGTVALVYLGVPLALNGGAGLPIEVAIPIAYVLALCLQFNLQRHFVFRHVDEFALSQRSQAGRYVVIAAIQYPTTAVATAVLPGLLGLSERATFLAVSLTMSVVFFIVLRTRIFHPDDGRDSREPGASVDELDVGQQVLGRRRRRADEGQPDAVQPPVQDDGQPDTRADHRNGDRMAARGADANRQL
jgi:putative flippase GtrA